MSAQPVVREVFHGCRIKEVSRTRGVNNKTGKRTEYRELIILP
jgi:hypothetical protein